MNLDSPKSTKFGQRHQLARALTLALGLSVSPFAFSAMDGYAPAATLVVTNCNDSGFGSLRDALTQAASGDIIDMSGLSCSTITLQSRIILSQDDLTLVGKTAPSGSFSRNVPVITSAAGADTGLLRHQGTGKLKLSKVSMHGGHTTSGWGGCVDSVDGSVELDSSMLKYCTVRPTSGTGVARGGAVYAGSNVTLDNSVIILSEATSTGGEASGGAVYAKGNVVLKNKSEVSQNLAEGVSARGGGIFAGGTLQVVLERSKITSNEASATGTGGAHGGGIFVTGTSTVGLGSGIQVSSNKAKGSGAKGGGFFLNSGGSFKYSSFTNNKADNEGGGIYSAGGISLDGCTITGNSAGSGTVGGSGGGIRAMESLTLEKSTVTGNHAAASGGGLSARGNAKIVASTIANNTARNVAGASVGDNATTPILINQSTISGNESSNSIFGAGLFVKHDALIKNSTITGNIERNSADKKYGAGIRVQDGKTVDLSSTIVSGNLFESTSSPGTTRISDIGGIGGGGSTATLTGSHNIIGFSLLTTPPGTLSVDPKLGPLQDNGGATWTHMPLPSSPAVNAGIPNSFTTDQRGAGFPRVVGAAADIGAIEYSVLTIEIFSDGFE